MRILSSGILVAKFIIAGEVIDISFCFSPIDIDKTSITDKLRASLDKLSDDYVYCCGVNKDELKVSCVGIGHGSKRSNWLRNHILLIGWCHRTVCNGFRCDTMHQ